MSVISQTEYQIPLNNFVSHISTSYMKWETRSWKWEGRNREWEMRNWKWEMRDEKLEIMSWKEGHWILPWEMGIGNPMRILATEVSTSEFNRAVQWPPVSDPQFERGDGRGQIPQENLRNLSLIHVNKSGSLTGGNGQGSCCEHRGSLLSITVEKHIHIPRTSAPSEPSEFILNKLTLFHLTTYWCY